MILQYEPDNYCDECGSQFLPAASAMMGLCAECAHQLYGYSPCEHDFMQQLCTKCGWDGSRSDYLRKLLESPL